MLPLNWNEPDDRDESRGHHSNEKRSVKTEEENVTQRRMRDAYRS
jgi:hypothetical protein